MLDRNSSFPIFLTALFSLFLSLPLIGASDTLPAKSTAPTNAAPAPVVPAPPAESLPPATATTERPTTYTVVSGDTLWDLSHKFNCSVKALKTLNKLKKNALKPGQVLQIPPLKEEKPVTSPPAAKPTTSVKPKPVSSAPQSQTASHSTVCPHAQPVQDFDIPASTFASCPTPPSVSEPEISTVPASPEPALVETPAPRALPVAVSELNPPTPQVKTMSATLPPAPQLTSHSPDPLITTPANEWGSRFLLTARALGNRDIEYNESWRPPGEAHSWDMDCSNTARYIYKVTTGIQLPRTASDQYYYLHLQNKAWDVPQTSSGFADCNFLRENLKPGDLLFWENTYRPERQPPITHVMVYLGKNAKGQWIMAGSQTGKGGEHNRSHGGPDVYVFDPTRPCGGYTTWLGMVHHQGRFCAYGRPLEADRTKLAVAAND
jgi:cell wall-associated NlpC family hydrolase